MSFSLPYGPTSFWTRFARGRVRFGDVLSIVLAGTGLCALALVGLDAVLTDAPVRADVRAAVPADQAFTVRDLGTYVGNWVSERGAHLIVTKSGAVWADAGKLMGSARLDGRDPTRLVFEGQSFRCTYRIAAEQPDALVWSIVDGTTGTACPQGRYSRRFTF